MAKLRLLKQAALLKQVLDSQHRSIEAKTVRSVMTATFAKLAEAFVKGQSFRIPNFGTLRVRSLAARKGRDPRTGVALEIPAKRTVRLVVAEGLKQRLNTTKTTNKHNKRK